MSKFKRHNRQLALIQNLLMINGAPMTVWNTKTPLMIHQQSAVQKLLGLKVGALFMDMGTGKTRTAIELAKLRQHKIKRVVWFCPVSVKYTIAREVQKHTNIAHDEIIVFNQNTNSQTKDLDKKLFVIIGIESMSSSDRVMYAAQKVLNEESMVVLDESTYIKNHYSKRAKRIRVLSQNCRYRLILTGTAMTQGAVDLFSQMNFLSPKILDYVSFYEFAEKHLVYEYIKKPNGVKIKTNRIVDEVETELLAEKIAPYSYQVKKSECLDLPEKIYTSYGCYLTDEQYEACIEAKEQFAMSILSDEYYSSSSIPIFKLFGSLQSIACGFWQNNGRFYHYHHNRIKALMDALCGLDTNDKVVIWAKYHYCIDEITNMLIKEYGSNSVHQYHGKISEAKRKNNLIDWQKKGRFIVATQSAGGHGLNELLSAHHVIFYANSFKYSERLQAEDRTHRIGQTHACWYADIYSYDSIDERINKNLETKGDTLRIFMNKMNELRQQGLKEELVNMIMEL